MTEQLHEQFYEQFADQKVFILLVEDNPADAELAIRALRRGRISNQIHLLKDGAEALDFIFCRGDYAHRSINDYPKMILLDLNANKLSALLSMIKDMSPQALTQAKRF